MDDLKCPNVMLAYSKICSLVKGEKYQLGSTKTYPLELMSIVVKQVHQPICYGEVDSWFELRTTFNYPCMPLAYQFKLQCSMNMKREIHTLF
jgi:hypothetical protein